jgi:uncharacterized glyoxalase superfamily protein PhnB
MTRPNDRFDHVFVAPADYSAALVFYRDTLGWQVDFAWGGDGEPPQPRGCQLSAAGDGAMRIVIAEQHAADDHSWTGGINGRRPTLHLRVDDLDARFAAIADASIVVVKPEATHWGTRWFVVKDPDDNLIAYEQAI